MGERPRPRRDRRGRARGAQPTAIEPVLFGDAVDRSARARAPRDLGRDRDGREAGRGRAREAGELARRVRPRRRGGDGGRRRLGREHRRDARGRACSSCGASRACMRPAIAVPIPGRRGPSVLLDCGANADARPEHLLQFATMGAVFAEEILGVPNPEVRLLSIGEEPEKGNQLTLEAHELLAASDLNFKGNTEGRDILAGAADVVVTDGFTGNVTLKLLEGTILTLLDALRERDHRDDAGQARRLADPAGGAAAPPPARSGHLRRGLSARSARPRGDRARQLLPHRDRQCDPPRGPRRGARRRRPRSLHGCPSGPRLYDRRAYRPQRNEVTWQRRARKSSSGSRKS